MCDHLRLKGNSKVLKALCANSAANDTILWSGSVTKINRKGKHQTRVLLVTNRHILNLMPDNYAKCNRCIEVRSVHHLSTSLDAQEFVIHAHRGALIKVLPATKGTPFTTTLGGGCEPVGHCHAHAERR